MNNKHRFKKAAALFLGLALTVGATGCGFITTDNQKDLEQVVATVDISGKLAKNENYKAVAGDLKKIVDKLSTEVLKRDLVSYYLSTGYNYVEQYGYSYEDTFNMLLDGLVSREILIQNAVAYYLKNKNASYDACEAFVNAKLAGIQDEKLREMVKADHYEVLVLQYFLSIGDAKEEAYKKAEYSLKKSLNDSLDSLEQSYITAESEDEGHEEARTLPTGVGTAKEDYYNEGYMIYTGRNALSACVDAGYEALEGSTVTTRQKAYNAFLTNLQAYNLINVDKKKGEVENTSDITKLHYYYVELSSILGQSLITKYFESLENEVSSKMDAAYVQAKYNEMLAQQTHDYANDHTAFTTALDGVAEGSYLLYGLQDYGFVSSILIPFSTAQNIQYTQAQNRGLTESELFRYRNEIAANITATDLRDTWISSHDHANYSYKRPDGNYYFFEDSVEPNGKDEALKHYAGNYYYRGEVDAEGNPTKNKEKLTIDQFIERFEEYVCAEADASIVDVNKKGDFYNTSDFKTDGKIDYNKFTYYEARVDLGDDVKASDFLNRNSKQYKALAAVNELTFAYSTDPGSLNSYMGYAISPYTTNFVKEYEAAAQATVARGVGAYSVSVNQYGWHIVYCTFKFDAGEVYSGLALDESKEYWASAIKNENGAYDGTFANLFYETIKEAAYNNHATEEQNRAIKEYDVGECVTRFEKAYKDLLEMDKQ